MPQNRETGTPETINSYFEDMLSLRKRFSEDDCKFSERVFYAQGKFMENLSDEFASRTHNYFTPQSYNDMSFHDFRVYLTWRTYIRKGIIKYCSPFMLTLYLKELVNIIGVEDCNEGFRMILFVTNEYKKHNIISSQTLNEWLKTFYVVNDFNESFPELLKQNGVVSSEIDPLFNNDKLSDYVDLINASSYKLTTSRFIDDELMQFIMFGFVAVLRNLEPLFNMYGLSLHSIINGNSYFDRWEPCATSIMNNDSGNRTVILSNHESYLFRDGKWWIKRNFNKNSILTSFSGYIIRRIESQLRIQTKSKYSLDPQKHTLLRKLSVENQKRCFARVADDKYFDIIIDEVILKLFESGRSVLNMDYVSKFTTKISVKLVKLQKTPNYKAFSEICLLSYLYHSVTDQNILFFEQIRVLNGCVDAIERYYGCDLTDFDLSKMDFNQLRSYITFRTKAKNGSFDKVSPCYVFFLCYETISKISNDNEDGFELLSQILLNYSYIGRNFERKVSGWIKDFYILNDFKMPFNELAVKNGIERYYPTSFLDWEGEYNVLDVYSWFSGYRIENSKFYSGKTEPIIRGCFTSVIDSVKTFFMSKDINFMHLLLGCEYIKNQYKPYYGAPIVRKKSAVKYISLGLHEKYTIKDNDSTVEMRIDSHKTGAVIVNFILKKIESVIREKTQYKYNLQADYGKMVAMLRSNQPDSKITQVLTDCDFAGLIEDSVSKYLKNNYIFVEQTQEVFTREPIAVSIDMSRIETIRQESEEIIEKLIINENNEFEDTNTEQINTLNENGDEWQNLYLSLSDVQLDAVEIINNGEDVSEKLFYLSQKNYILVEVLIESINDNAITHTGDIIIDSSGDFAKIYSDYIINIRNYLINGRK